MFLLIALLFASSQAVAAPASRQRAPRDLSPAPRVSVSDDFRFGQLGWTAGFADYSPVHESIMELEAGIRALPTELGVQGTGFFITAHNRSDDVFMFLKKKLTAADGIRPNHAYLLSFRILVASNAGGENCAGIGGHPGFSVYLKAGGSPEEPRAALVSDDYRMNVDKGQQSQGGPAATVAGNVSTGSTNCSGDAPFMTLERLHQHSFPVTSNAESELWLLVGTDSGFEGKTRLYYQSISVVLQPVQ